MGDTKKKEKKSSSSSDYDACTNCSKLNQVIESYIQTIESLTARIEALETVLNKFQTQQPIEQSNLDNNRIRVLEKKV